MPPETRIAVLGHGLIGQHHAAIIKVTPGCTLAGIVDPDPRKRGTARELGCPVHPDLASLLTMHRPDGIVVATPTHHHAAHALASIEAGVPVLVEKPLAATCAEAEEVAVAATEANLPLLVGHHRRHNSLVAAAKAVITGGAIGAVRAIQATCWLAKPDAYFHEEPWRGQPGTGPLAINLIHDVDLLRVLCGEVDKVQAMAAPSRRGHDNEDLAAAILHFATGVIATISVADGIAAPWSWELTARENPAYPPTGTSCYLIGGTQGSLSLPDLTLWRHVGPPDWKTPMTEEAVPFVANDPLVQQMQHFTEVLQGRVAPLVPGAEGLRSLAVIEAITEASRTGLSVPLCPT